jgi:endonuclease/exonuclease/phosphatase (EEP) superfamily protein YafD
LQQLTNGKIGDQVAGDAIDPQAKRRARRHLQWSGVALGLFAGLAGLLAGRLGQLYPLFDVFAQFGAQFTMVVAAFAFAAFVPRYKALIGMVLLCGLFVAYGAWPHFVSRTAAVDVSALEPLLPVEKRLNVAHFNTYGGNSRNQDVANEMLRLDADIVTLIEFERSKEPLLDMLAAKYPYRATCQAADRHCNLAVVSKYPIGAVTGRAIWRGPPFIRVEMAGEFSGLTVIGVHTTRFPHWRAQFKQVQALVRMLESETGSILLMGDFNATPFSRLPRMIEEGSGLKRLTRLPTWPSTYGLPQLAIDHIFVSEDLRPLASMRIGNPVGSDHYPITIPLALKAQ